MKLKSKGNIYERGNLWKHNINVRIDEQRIKYDLFVTIYRKIKNSGNECTFKPIINPKPKKYLKTERSVYQNSGVQEHIDRQVEAFQERLEKQRRIEKGRTIIWNIFDPNIYYNVT